MFHIIPIYNIYSTLLLNYFFWNRSLSYDISTLPFT